MGMKKSLFLSVFLIVALCVAQAVAFAAEGGVDWNVGTVRGRGYGVPMANPVNPGQAVATAREAAIAEAYAALAEQVAGVSVDSERDVKNLQLMSKETNTKVNAVIRNAKIVNEKWDGNLGMYFVEMEMPMYGASNSLSSAVLPVTPPQERENFPKPTTKVEVTVEIQQTRNAGGYTGLVVDCRGMSLTPAMSPVIKNTSGTKIYGYKNLDSKKVIHNGMAGYASDLGGATRAGNRPLVVKAVSLDNHNFNPVLSVEDANRVLAENEVSHFLDNCAVVFLR